MTYDPDRDARAPSDMNPNRRPYERRGRGWSSVLMLGLMAAFIAVGFWFYTTKDTVTGDRAGQDRVTTGASAPAAPPAPPSQTRE
jgi:hypothetical protein